MPSYATVDELAEAVRTRVTPTNTAYLQRCVDAASEEIDAFLCRLDTDALSDPPPQVVKSTCLARGVEWFKANDAAYGVVGYTETGALTAPKDTFARHAHVIGPLKQQWGLA